MQTPRAGLPLFAQLFGAKERPVGTENKPPHLPELALPDFEKVPLLGPIMRRGLPDHVVANVIRDRLLKLIGRVAESQKEVRTERAKKMSQRIEVLRANIEKLEIKDVASADALFHTVGKLSRLFETIIEDADYLSFRTIGTISSLRAANLALRSSQLLWQSIRVGDALRQPDIFPRALGLIGSTEKIALAANRGEDVRLDLTALENAYAELAADVEARAGDSGLEKATTGMRVSRRVWDYRMAIEKVALERSGSTKPRMTNGELLAWIKENGLPPDVIKELLTEDVVKNLLGFAQGEGAERGRAGYKLRARALKLAEKIEAIDPKTLSDVDVLEPTVRELSTDLDTLLKDAERIIRPLDGPVRKLRAANDALKAMKGLFTAMRLSRAMEDPAFRAQAEELAGQVSTLGDSDRTDRYETRLAALEDGLNNFDSELRDRLKIDKVPLAKESLGTVRTALRVARFREALNAASQPEVMEAFRALSDLEMAPAERAKIYEKAQGAPLTEALVNLIVASRQLELGFTLGDLGRGMNDLLRLGGRAGELNPYLAKSPLAFLGKANFEKAFADFDGFVKSADTPEGRKWIDNSLNIFRAAVKVEAGNVERVALFVPPEDRAYVATAITEWAGKSALAITQFLGEELSDPGGEAVADVLDAMIAATEEHLDTMIAEDPKELGKGDIKDLTTDMNKRARSKAFESSQEQLISALSQIAARDLDKSPLGELPALNAQLADALQCVETTPDSRDAMRAIVKDLGASARMLVHMVHLFGAASNDRMDEDKRATAIRSSVERMGPLFVKMMQTLVNMQSLLTRVRPNHNTAKTDPLFAALKKLQDECTPLPWSTVKEEIERSLGKTIEEAFVWIDPEPLKAGSIGQTHRAKIKDGDRVMDVVVKVLRPGIDQNFADTIRVTQLTLSVFREMLRLDHDGAIFGELKPRAEELLPMLEQALEGFIESFRIETNFTQEAENMRRFGKLLGPERYIAVPLVYDSHTKGNVLTMQEMRGFKLSNWLDRYTWAQERTPLVEERGPCHGVPEAKARALEFLKEACGVEVETATIAKHNHGWVLVKADAHKIWVREESGQIESKYDLPPPNRWTLEKRATKWAERAIGLPVKGMKIEPHQERRGFHSERGALVTIQFHEDKQPPAQIFVRDKDAAIIPKTIVPDLSEHGIAALRDRLGSTFINQVLAGLLHGDPHEGNFFIMPDGKTIALLDFGLAIELKLHDALGPLKLLAGAMMQEPRQMAEAIASMAIIDPSLSERAKKRIKVRLARHCRDVLKEASAEIDSKRSQINFKGMPIKERMKTRALLVFERACLAMERSIDVMLNRVGLPPMPHVLQSLKATFSMGGNIAAIEKKIPNHSEASMVRRAAADLFRYQAIAPVFGESMHRRKAERIDRYTIVDARALASST